jgi:uncharacterized membrane protein YbhN (UPF0104 family)
VLLSVLLGVVLIAATVAILGHVADFEKVSRALDQANLNWLPLCLLGLVLAYVGFVLAYRDLARADGGPDLGYWTATRVVALGFGATVVGSGVGALAASFWALHRAGLPLDESGRRVLAMNTLEWASLGAAAAAAGGLALAGADHGVPAAMSLAWIATVGVCLLGAAWVSSPRRSQALTAIPPPPPASEGQPVVARLMRWARTGLAIAIGGVVFMRRILLDPRRHVAGLGGFPVYWAGNLLCFYAALSAFGGRPSLLGLILGYATGYVASALPLPVGGAGSIEASLAFSMNAVGVPLEAALLGALVFRAFTFWIPLVPAAILLTRVRGLSDHLGELAERSERGAAGEPAPSLAGR